MAKQNGAKADKTMQGKICLVTGATSGIGLVTARELARQGATVVLVGRDTNKTQTTVEQIKQQTGNNSVEGLVADLSSQQEVRQLADQFKRRYRQLHVLVNNAGAVYDSRRESVDGIELTLALNHLSYFLLTNLLLDTIVASAPARIVNVASDAHRMTSINFDDLQAKQKYSGFRVYGQSKLANILFTKELARRLQGTNVTTNSVHPGLVATGFARNNAGLLNFLFGWILRPFARTPEKGAETPIYLASASKVQGLTGLYFSDKQPVTPTAAAQDMAAAERLWQVSAELTKLSKAIAV
jgi:NAD(P)-dependent dehydrogenase (short-subunit alcohol dehydrogenase family)